MVGIELGCVVHPDAAIPFLRLASRNEDSPIETTLPPPGDSGTWRRLLNLLLAALKRGRLRAVFCVAMSIAKEGVGGHER